MILSASGWRTVFARSGDEEARDTEVSDALLVLAALAAHLFAEAHEVGGESNAIAIGTDARPTGPRIQQAVIRGLLGSQRHLRVLGIAAAPEIIAYANNTPGVGAFLYISASHNPIGHNGLKMGVTPGGVLDSVAANRLIETFRRSVRDQQLIATLCSRLREEDSPRERSVYLQIDDRKSEALRAYESFVFDTLTGPGSSAGRVMGGLPQAVEQRGFTVVGEMNGSARGASIDGEYLSRLGCTVKLLNQRPGAVVHQSVPEGPGLELCREAVRELGRADNRGIVLGYVPDNDGDRGNLVYFDDEAGDACAIDAQSVFAIACIAELSWLEMTGALTSPDLTAIVVNGPTSLRIERIAQVFGVRVVRAEVGEANVLTCADRLRSQGHLVRILGEGSNGGTIVHPARVRDPLNSIGTILKLFRATDTETGRTPLDLWYQRTAHSSSGTTVAELIRSMPTFTTTSAYEERAVMRVGSVPQSALKRRFEENLPVQFAGRSQMLRRGADITEWRVINYESTEAREGIGNRTGSESGGLKVMLTDSNGRDTGFLWMRGSKTEPVFRIMVDIEGHRSELENELLQWLREMVGTAAVHQ